MGLFNRDAVVILTEEERRFFRQEIKDGKAIGDCETDGLKLIMKDYEGAGAMYGKFMARTPSSTREHMVWGSVINKINASIRKAVASGGDLN